MGRTPEEIFRGLIHTDRTLEGALKDKFKEQTGRDLGKPAKQYILNSGHTDCKHPRILYIDNCFDGQAWWCDDCERHERMDYSPGFKIRFPANALIRTPNPRSGGLDFYSFRANQEGVAEETLDRNEWTARYTINEKTRTIQ